MYFMIMTETFLNQIMLLGILSSEVKVSRNAIPGPGNLSLGHSSCKIIWISQPEPMFLFSLHAGRKLPPMAKVQGDDISPFII